MVADTCHGVLCGDVCDMYGLVVLFNVCVSLFVIGCARGAICLFLLFA